MTIAHDHKIGKTGAQFWILSGVLFVVAVALRWTDLDYMSFTFDHAAVAFRAMEVHEGRFPFTGIVNSLGFRNGPGYIWTLLPTFAFSASPVSAAAWHGLLSATMVFPLALLGRRFRRDALAWLPAIMAAALPISVFAGRDLWAQHLLSPLAAWALLWLMQAMDGRRSDAWRGKRAALCLAVMAWAVSVHFAALPGLVISAVAVAPLLLRQRRRALWLLLPATCISATLVPSAFDAADKLANPEPPPAYVTAAEPNMTPAEPLFIRLEQSLRRSVGSFSDRTWPGMIRVLSDANLTVLHLYDAVVQLLVLAGLLFCVRALVRRTTGQVSVHQTDAALLLLWIFVAPVAAALVMERVNDSYFCVGLPATWLLVLFVPGLQPDLQNERSVSLPIRATAAAVTLAIFAGALYVSILLISSVVSAGQYIPGYYQPFVKQLAVARYTARQGVPAEHVFHAGGPIVEESYRYLVKYMGGAQPPRNHEEGDAPYAVLQDDAFVKDQPARRDYFLNAGAAHVESVMVMEMPSRGAMEVFLRNYYKLPR